MNEPKTEEIAESNRHAAKPIGLRGCQMAVGCVVVLLIVSAWISFRAWNRAGEKRARALLSNLQEQGVPTNIDEFGKYYSTPAPELDATDLWMRAGDIFNIQFSVLERIA